MLTIKSGINYIKYNKYYNSINTLLINKMNTQKQFVSKSINVLSKQQNEFNDNTVNTSRNNF